MFKPTIMIRRKKVFDEKGWTRYYGTDKVDLNVKLDNYAKEIVRLTLKLEENEKQRLEVHLRIVLEKSRSIKKDELEQLKQDFGPKRERVEVDLDEMEQVEEEDE